MRSNNFIDFAGGAEYDARSRNVSDQKGSFKTTWGNPIRKVRFEYSNFVWDSTKFSEDGFIHHNQTKHTHKERNSHLQTRTHARNKWAKHSGVLSFSAVLSHPESTRLLRIRRGVQEEANSPRGDLTCADRLDYANRNDTKLQRSQNKRNAKETPWQAAPVFTMLACWNFSGIQFCIFANKYSELLFVSRLWLSNKQTWEYHSCDGCFGNQIRTVSTCTSQRSVSSVRKNFENYREGHCQLQTIRRPRKQDSAQWRFQVVDGRLAQICPFGARWKQSVPAKLRQQGKFILTSEWEQRTSHERILSLASATSEHHNQWKGDTHSRCVKF